MKNKAQLLQEVNQLKNIAVTNFLLRFTNEVIQVIDNKIKVAIIKQDSTAILLKSEILSLALKNIRFTLQEQDPAYVGADSNSMLNVKNDYNFSPYQLLLDQLLFISKSYIDLNYNTNFYFSTTQGSLVQLLNKQSITIEERVLTNIDTLTKFVIILA